VALAADSRQWGAGTTGRVTWGRHGEQPPGTVIVDDDGEWPRAYTENDSHVYELGEGGRMVFDAMGSGYPNSRKAAQVQHAIRHDPARVLRQVAAMRKILDEHAPADWADYNDGNRIVTRCWRCSGGDIDVADIAGWHRFPCGTILALAEALGVEP
jgi:hypothetical protein